MKKVGELVKTWNLDCRLPLRTKLQPLSEGIFIERHCKESVANCSTTHVIDELWPMLS